MIKEFEEGRKEPFYYQVKPYGELIFVTLSPILRMVCSSDVCKL